MSLDTAPPTSSAALYSERPPRITKEDLFVVLALWMEHFPVESEQDLAKDNEDTKHHYSGHRKVGAVLVLPGPDIVYAVDCTRDGVHGVARLLMNHPDVAKGSKVFVSRKPCSFCTKLLVQSKVERVYFPPFEPEYHGVLKFTSEELETFMSSCELPVASQRNVPADSNKDLSALEIHNRKSVLEKFNSDGVLDHLTAVVIENLKLEKSSELEELISNKAVKLALEQFDREKSQVDTLFKRSTVGQSVLVPKVEETVLEREKKKDEMDNIRKRKMEELFDKFCKEEWIKTVKDNLSWPVFDENMANKFKEDFAKTMEWMARILVESGLDIDEEISFQPVVGEGKPKELQSKQFAHLIGMAQFLARRTDDPKRGVGAVIANEKMEIKALGWNGFPLKAIYGEFPRASDTDVEVDKKKYPFIIHAEQNALLMRNDKNLEGGTLFVTRSPCHECVPLIQMQGIKTVVLGKRLETKASARLSYSTFAEKVKKGNFTCYELGMYRRYILDFNHYFYV